MGSEKTVSGSEGLLADFRHPLRNGLGTRALGAAVSGRKSLAVAKVL
jgi:hypothetical protein